MPSSLFPSYFGLPACLSAHQRGSFLPSFCLRGSIVWLTRLCPLWAFYCWRATWGGRSLFWASPEDLLSILCPNKGQSCERVSSIESVSQTTRRAVHVSSEVRKQQRSGLGEVSVHKHDSVFQNNTNIPTTPSGFPPAPR